jgi:para-aminobenzoate synthetase component 1
VFISPSRIALTPREAALRLGDQPGFAWLDGGLSHGREGRFSFLGARPREVVVRRVGEPTPLRALAEIAADARGQSTAPRGAGANPDLSAEDVPAWIGHVAYDAAFGLGLPLHPRLPRTQALPCLHFARYGALLAYDHGEDRSYLVGDDAASCRALEELLAREPYEPSFSVGPVVAADPEAHARNVRSALERIAAGDVYEVNLARAYRAPFHGDALGLFLRMRALSPVPFGYFARGVDARGSAREPNHDYAIAGRSMERFLRYRRRDGLLWTSPIKGTIARGEDARDEAARLRADPKEHAEHAMVVDLMRNDLSRVAQAGSVRIRELMQVLPFAGLSHLISTVEGRARDGLGLAEILEGTFPPGSVTGAPKLSAMQLIEELEPEPRGVYTGAVGFIDRDGGCSLAVAIRTAVVHAGEVLYPAGGGIVIASDPERETRETELKARVFLDALAD